MPYVSFMCKTWHAKRLVRHQRRVNRDFFLNGHVFGAAADTPLPRQKWFSKYAQSMSVRYSVNVDIIGRFHDILQVFNNCFKNIFWSKMDESAKLVYRFTTSISELDVDPIVVVI